MQYAAVVDTTICCRRDQHSAIVTLLLLCNSAEEASECLPYHLHCTFHTSELTQSHTNQSSLHFCIVSACFSWAQPWPYLPVTYVTTCPRPVTVISVGSYSANALFKSSQIVDITLLCVTRPAIWAPGLHLGTRGRSGLFTLHRAVDGCYHLPCALFNDHRDHQHPARAERELDKRVLHPKCHTTRNGCVPPKILIEFRYSQPVFKCPFVFDYEVETFTHACTHTHTHTQFCDYTCTLRGMQLCSLLFLFSRKTQFCLTN